MTALAPGAQIDITNLGGSQIEIQTIGKVNEVVVVPGLQGEPGEDGVDGVDGPGSPFLVLEVGDPVPGGTAAGTIIVRY